MAHRKQKHGKVEARKARPLLRFKAGVLLVIIVVTFAFCFGMYFVSAVTQKDYWEKEIIAEMNQNQGENSNKNRTGTKVVNPVPSSERADESRMEACAFVGDVTAFTSYYKTSPGKVFTDTVTSMSESRMRSIGRSLRGTSPKAVYIWYQCPSDLEKAAAAYGELVDNLIDQMPTTPIYVLTATPAGDAEANQRIDTWNAALFAMADEKGLHYVDVSTTLKANDGTLASGYEDEETFYKTIGDLILTHIAD